MPAISVKICKECWRAHVKAGPDAKPTTWTSAKNIEGYRFAFNPLEYWVTCPFCDDRVSGLVTMSWNIPKGSIMPICEESVVSVTGSSSITMQ